MALAGTVRERPARRELLTPAINHHQLAQSHEFTLVGHLR
jgi:hypothetical protein